MAKSWGGLATEEHVGGYPAPGVEAQVADERFAEAGLQLMPDQDRSKLRGRRWRAAAARVTAE
jgi:hypothetical protein